jgi:hypothetical protein
MLSYIYPAHTVDFLCQQPSLQRLMVLHVLCVYIVKYSRGRVAGDALLIPRDDVTRYVFGTIEFHSRNFKKKKKTKLRLNWFVVYVCH